MILKLNAPIVIKIRYSRNLTVVGAPKAIATTHTRQQVILKISAIILCVCSWRSQRKYLGAQLRAMLDTGTGVILTRTVRHTSTLLDPQRRRPPTPGWSPSSTTCFHSSSELSGYISCYRKGSQRRTCCERVF